MDIKMLIQLCGVAHLMLGLGSLVIPKMLNWQSALAKMPMLIKQMFWTYAGYILCINLFFGIISLFLPDELISGSGLAFSITLLIALYWLARLVIQFTYFDKSEIPNAFIYTLGEWSLVALFVVFSIVYSYVCYVNFNLWIH